MQFTQQQGSSISMPAHILLPCQRLHSRCCSWHCCFQYPSLAHISSWQLLGLGTRCSPQCCSQLCSQRRPLSISLAQSTLSPAHNSRASNMSKNDNLTAHRLLSTGSHACGILLQASGAAEHMQLAHDAIPYPGSGTPEKGTNKIMPGLCTT